MQYHDTIGFADIDHGHYNGFDDDFTIDSADDFAELSIHPLEIPHEGLSSALRVPSDSIEWDNLIHM